MPNIAPLDYERYAALFGPGFASAVPHTTAIRDHKAVEATVPSAAPRPLTRHGLSERPPASPHQQADQNPGLAARMDFGSIVDLIPSSAFVRVAEMQRDDAVLRSSTISETRHAIQSYGTQRSASPPAFSLVA